MAIPKSTYMELHIDLTPRAAVHMMAECYADPELFTEKGYMKHGVLPCEGTGHPGSWCDACRFGLLIEVIDL